RELYAEVEQRLVLDEAFVAPLYHYASVNLTKPWIKRPFFASAGPSFATWTIDMAAKGDEVMR
ncbi:MAG: hypothetical protein ACRDIB_19030, partial [Ardenticatenaceae bacterium]